MIKIAVLGAGGFFGARLIEMAQTRSDLEMVPVLRSFRSMARLSKFNSAARRADTSDVPSLAKAFEGCDVVINVTTGDWLGAKPDAERFLAAAREAGAKLFLHMSSASVFGSVTNPAINDDSRPEGAEWFLYAVEKGKAEDYLRSQMNDERTRIVVLRPGLIWGPRSGWLTGPARELVTGSAWLTNNGEGICNLCHVDNLARYVLQVIDAKQPRSGFYNVADAETMTWRQYYEAIAKGLDLPVSHVRTIPSQPVKFSPGVAVEWFKSQRPGYHFHRWLVNNVSSENKSLLKWHLPALAGGGVAPPSGGAEPSGNPKKFTRETWGLHHTARKLPSDKFWRDFGRPQLRPFTETMPGAIAWLRFAGFTDY